MEIEMNVEGAREAFEMLKPHIETVDEVRRVNVSLQKIAVFAAGMGRRVTQPEVRGRFAELPVTVFDVELLDRLEPAALALWYAVMESKRAAVGASQAALDPDVVAQAMEVKRRMVRVLDYHLGDDDDPARAELDAIREGTGYLDLATDLMRLARMYEAHAPALAVDVRHYQAADREEANQVAHAILKVLGDGREGDAVLWADYVTRSWTLLAETYDEVSAAGRFLFRHQGGAERFPSLIAMSRNRAGRRPGDEAPEDPGGEPGVEDPGADPDAGLPGEEPGDAN